MSNMDYLIFLKHWSEDIILESKVSGNLKEALCEFANNAEKNCVMLKPIIQFMTLAGYTFSPLTTNKNYCGDLVIFIYALRNDGFKLGLNDFIEYVNLNAEPEIVNILCPISDKVLV